jgi:DNA-binding CsgD family transcriptional regulator
LATLGDSDSAFAAFEQALREHEQLPDTFERGRTQLALGAAQRRAKQKRRARDTLTEALAVFEPVGAVLWADRVHAELARIGGRVPSGALTETERRIAELVAQGGSNKEVAAQLFITPRTVEGHLTKIYEKLGVRSRAELAHRLSEPGSDAAPAITR